MLILNLNQSHSCGSFCGNAFTITIIKLMWEYPLQKEIWRAYAKQH